LVALIEKDISVWWPSPSHKAARVSTQLKMPAAELPVSNHEKIEASNDSPQHESPSMSRPEYSSQCPGTLHDDISEGAPASS